MKVITLPSYAWRKSFFPKEGSLEDRGNIFTGRSLRTEVPPPFFLAELILLFLKIHFVLKGVKDSTIARLMSDSFNILYIIRARADFRSLLRPLK